MDLGLSNHMLDSSGRGFSFMRDEPLDMRAGNTDVTASRIVNTFTQDELFRLFIEFGQERFAARIARRIIRERASSPIQTSKQLADLVRRVVPRTGHLHPATRVFQALRMKVNDELKALQDALDAIPDVLADKGRAAVISFHSLEDGTVKRHFRTLSKTGQFKLINKKPMMASQAEKDENPRSRSARLRVLEKSPHE
jgi:16S rRNA (cytosine1402-N4)-methyltransferase